MSIAGSQGPSTRLGSITVHGFHDLNRNDVQDEGEEDIEGWLIRLYRWDETDRYMVGEGRTDPNGMITFGDLAPATYKVWEEEVECWEPTVIGGLPIWRGGYFTFGQLGPGQSLLVEFGNVYGDCPTPPQRCIELAKTGPETAHPGETITYHYQVHNCGDIWLEGGVHVYDPLISETGAIWSGDLEPGQAHEFDQTFTLPANHCGDFVNHAWAVGQPPGHSDIRDDAYWTVDIRCEPPEPTGLALEPEVVTNVLPLDALHVFTATVQDQYGEPMEGITVSFSTDFGGLYKEPPFTPTSVLPDGGHPAQEDDGVPYIEIATDAWGRAAVIVSSTIPGTAYIQAWVDDGDGEYHEGEVTDLPSVKRWVESVPGTLKLEPPLGSLLPGESVAYHSTIQDADGNTQDVTSETEFDIRNEAGGAWVGNVYVSGALGTWIVSAQYGGQTVTVMLRVGHVIYMPVIYHTGSIPSVISVGTGPEASESAP